MAHPADAPASRRLTLRPRKIRIVCWVLAPAVFLVFVGLASALTGPTGSGTAVFQPSDRIAMIGLGVLAAAAVLAFTRPKVTADRTGIKIRNVVGSYDLPWEVVRSVRFEPGNPWVSLELHDDDLVAVMAIQAADKEYAVAGARALRRLLAEHTAAAGDVSTDRVSEGD